MNRKVGMQSTVVMTVLLFSILIFSILSYGVEFHSNVMNWIDTKTFDWWLVHAGEPQMNFHSGFIDSYFTFFAKYFDVISVVGITMMLAVIFMMKKYYAFAVWLLGVVASGGILGIWFKQLFHRARPYDHLLVDTGYSFPSGHSLSSSLIFVILIFLLIPRIQQQSVKYAAWGISALSWISILISRLYFHAHYLTDVLGGVMFSLFWVMLAVEIYSRWLEPLITKKIQSNKSIRLMRQQ